MRCKWKGKKRREKRNRRNKKKEEGWERENTSEAE
jgi:hypothetical protein